MRAAAAVVFGQVSDAGLAELRARKLAVLEDEPGWACVPDAQSSLNRPRSLGPR